MTTTLSKRELEIVELVGSKHTDAEIADALGISRSTVSAHLTRIAEKLRLTEAGIPRRKGIRQWLADRARGADAVTQTP